MYVDVCYHGKEQIIVRQNACLIYYCYVMMFGDVENYISVIYAQIRNLKLLLSHAN
jgi:hypothetical protein